MKKHILVYFKSENDAVSARAGLQRVRVSNLHVDVMPGDDANTKFIPIPVLYTAVDGDGVGSAGVIATGPGTTGMIDDDEMLPEDKPLEQDFQMTHLIEAEVANEDYEKALAILIKHNGYFKEES